MDMGGRPQEHQQPSRDPDFSSPACLVVVVPLRRCVNYSSTHGCKKDWRWLKFRFWFRTTMVTTTKPLFSPVFGVRFWRGKHLLQGLVSQAFSAGGCRSPQATSNSLKTWIKKKKHNSFPIFTRDPQGELLSNHDSMMVTQVALFFFTFSLLPCVFLVGWSSLRKRIRTIGHSIIAIAQALAFAWNLGMWQILREFLAICPALKRVNLQKPSTGARPWPIFSESWKLSPQVDQVAIAQHQPKNVVCMNGPQVKISQMCIASIDTILDADMQHLSRFEQEAPSWYNPWQSFGATKRGQVMPPIRSRPRNRLSALKELNIAQHSSTIVTFSTFSTFSTSILVLQGLGGSDDCQEVLMSCEVASRMAYKMQKWNKWSIIINNDE